MQVSDGLSPSTTQDVTFTVAGTNDGPLLSDTTNPPAVLELLDASAQNLAPIAGNFSVTDLDNGETLTPSVVGGPTVLLDGNPFVLPAGAAALIAAGAFTLTGAISNGGAVNIGYTYDPAAANLGFLSSGQSLTITYTVQVSDGLSPSNTQDVTFTVTGTDDGPLLSDTTNPPAVLELLDASAQKSRPIAGNFSVTDLDNGDTLTPSVVGSPMVLLDGNPFVLPAGAAALIAAGAFTLTGAISNGGAVNIGYTYDPAAANLDFLRNNQSLTITYTVQVSDGLSSSNTQDVTFTVTGTNDGPLLSDTTNPPAVLELLDASAQNLAPIAGNFSVTDLDNGETLTPERGGEPDGPARWQPVRAAGRRCGTDRGRRVHPDRCDIERRRRQHRLHLRSSGRQPRLPEQRPEPDHHLHGAGVRRAAPSTTQDVTFTVTGTNDTPLLSDTTNPPAVLELLDASAQNLTPITGNFSVTDLDIGDTLTPSVVGGPMV